MKRLVGAKLKMKLGTDFVLGYFQIDNSYKCCGCHHFLIFKADIYYFFVYKTKQIAFI